MCTNRWSKVTLENKPDYYHPVQIWDGSNQYVAWLAIGDDGDFLWTILGTNRLINATHWKSLDSPPSIKQS